MRAEIITIGGEILSGQITNTNAAWMGRQLYAAGIEVVQATSVPDDKDYIEAALREALKRAELVLITGGLGPTRDDVTKNALCDFFKTGLVFNQDVLEDIRSFLRARGIPENELHKTQAMVPRNCAVIRNVVGTAPGMWFEVDGRIVVSVPGVPAEMKIMLQNVVLPGVQTRITPGVILYRSVLVHGISESNLALKVAQWERDLPDGLTLASLPHGGFINLRLKITAKDESAATRIAAAQMDKLKGIIGTYIYDFSDSTPEQLIANLLLEKSLTVAVIEAGSTGALAARILAVLSGAERLTGWAVALTDRAIEELSGVDFSAMNIQGVTAGPEAAKKMAICFRDRLKSDIGFATLAVAEKAGQVYEKQERSIWVAVDSAEGAVSFEVPMSAYHIDRVLFILLEHLRKMG
jgi:nicotinamide-nucleotide amidase